MAYKPIHLFILLFIFLYCIYGRKELNSPLQRHLHSHSVIYTLLSLVTMDISCASALAGSLSCHQPASGQLFLARIKLWTYHMTSYPSFCRLQDLFFFLYILLHKMSVLHFSSFSLNIISRVFEIKKWAAASCCASVSHQRQHVDVASRNCVLVIPSGQKNFVQHLLTQHVNLEHLWDVTEGFSPLKTWEIHILRVTWFY